MAKHLLRITHRPSDTLIAEGPLGWGITPFEGNVYIRRKYLCSDGFRTNFIPGFCPYKFIYVWLDFGPPRGPVAKSLGWRYLLANPLFPFIWFRVGLSRAHADLDFETILAK